MNTGQLNSQDLMSLLDFEKTITLYGAELSNITNLLHTLIKHINSLPVAVCFLNAKKELLYLNDAALKLFCLDSIDYRNHQISKLLTFTNHPLSNLLSDADMQRLMAGQTVRRDEIIPNKNGDTTIYDFWHVPHLEADGRLAGITIFALNVTEQRQMQMDILLKNQQLSSMAITDELTGVYNRRHLVKRFQEEFEKAHRFASPLSCIIIDIDRFKLINDTYGHLQGDMVIVSVCRVIKNSLRIYDIFGRFGGEEFLVILPETTAESAELLAERLRQNVLNNHVKLGGNPTCITISLGVTAMSKLDTEINDLIKRADDALYIAKQTGRNKSVLKLAENR